jgi:hypothetical protein
MALAVMPGIEPRCEAVVPKRPAEMPVLGALSALMYAVAQANVRLEVLS